MPKNKLPGSDGFPAEFFLEALEAVGDYMIEAILEFFDTGKMLKALSTTLVTLVPKCLQPICFEHNTC